MKDILIKDNKLETMPIQVKDMDEKQGIVEFYANVFGVVDSDRDVSLPGSFSKTIKENRARLRHFLNHNMTQLIGAPKELKEDDKGLLVASQLNMNKQIGRDIFEDYKLYSEMGMSLEHSVGLEAIKYQISEEEEVRRVSEWKLWEYSTLTAWGANQEALTQNIKGLNKETIEYMLNKGNYSDERFKELEELNKLLNKTNALFSEPPQGTQNYEPLLSALNETEKLLTNGK